MYLGVKNEYMLLINPLFFEIVKAGGMRVARHHHSSTGESKNEMTKEEQEEYGTRLVHNFNAVGNLYNAVRR